MNKAQKIVLLLGLVIIVTIFYAPYRVTEYSHSYNKNDYVLIAEWVEFHFIFTPPLSVDETNVTVKGGEYGSYVDFFTYYENRDYILQLSLILGEIVLIAILFFVFKTKT